MQAAVAVAVHSVEHKNERGRASGYRSAFATRSSVASLDCSCIIKQSVTIDRVRDTAWCQCWTSLCNTPGDRAASALQATE